MTFCFFHDFATKVIAEISKELLLSWICSFQRIRVALDGIVTLQDLTKVKKVFFARCCAWSSQAYAQKGKKYC